MYDLLNMNVDYLKHRIKVLKCLKYKTDAKNMENFSVRLSEYFDELRDLMYIITGQNDTNFIKIMMHKCIHKFFCVI